MELKHEHWGKNKIKIENYGRGGKNVTVILDTRTVKYFLPKILALTIKINIVNFIN